MDDRDLERLLNDGPAGVLHVQVHKQVLRDLKNERDNLRLLVSGDPLICPKCKTAYEFDDFEPFAHCECGTTEWANHRPVYYYLQRIQALTAVLHDVLERVDSQSYELNWHILDDELKKKAEALLPPPGDSNHGYAKKNVG